MTPLELAQKSSSFLAAILDQSESLTLETHDLEEVRLRFVQRHGRNIVYLASDMLVLYSSNRYITANLSIRVMLEDMFNIGAAVRHERFAVEKMLGEFEKTSTGLKKIAPLNDLTKWFIQFYAEEAIRLQEQFASVISSKRWEQMRDIAIAADMEKVYLKEYFLLCHHTHAEVVGVMREQSRQVGTGQSLESGITAILYSLYNLNQLLHLNHKEAIQGKTAEMLEVFSQLKAGDAFGAMDRYYDVLPH